jgi:hypothetical protein
MRKLNIHFNPHGLIVLKVRGQITKRKYDFFVYSLTQECLFFSLRICYLLMLFAKVVIAAT